MSRKPNLKIKDTGLPYKLYNFICEDKESMQHYLQGLKDKYDNKGLYNDNHNILTNNLIKKEFVSDDSSDLFLYDDLFKRLLDENNTFENLSLITNYILNNVKSRNYLDENDEPIKNRFGYFKNAIISNLNRFKRMEEQNELFEYDWLNDDELEI